MNTSEYVMIQVSANVYQYYFDKRDVKYIESCMKYVDVDNVINDRLNYRYIDIEQPGVTMNPMFKDRLSRCNIQNDIEGCELELEVARLYDTDYVNRMIKYASGKKLGIRRRKYMKFIHYVTSMARKWSLQIQSAMQKHLWYVEDAIADEIDILTDDRISSLNDDLDYYHKELDYFRAILDMLCNAITTRIDRELVNKHPYKTFILFRKHVRNICMAYNATNTVDCHPSNWKLYVSLGNLDRSMSIVQLIAHADLDKDIIAYINYDSKTIDYWKYDRDTITRLHDDYVDYGRECLDILADVYVCAMLTSTSFDNNIASCYYDLMGKCQVIYESFTEFVVGDNQALKDAYFDKQLVKEFREYVKKLKDICDRESKDADTLYHKCTNINNYKSLIEQQVNPTRIAIRKDARNVINEQLGSSKMNTPYHDYYSNKHYRWYDDYYWLLGETPNEYEYEYDDC